MTSTTPPESPPPSAVTSMAIPAFSVGSLLGDAATEDKHDDVKTAESALKAMKLGNPDVSEY
jgi:hypothetical protein